MILRTTATIIADTNRRKLKEVPGLKKNLKFLKSLIEEIKKNKTKVNKNREVLQLNAEMIGIILLHLKNQDLSKCKLHFSV